MRIQMEVGPTTSGDSLTANSTLAELNIISWSGCALPSLACGMTCLAMIGHRLLTGTRAYIRLNFLIMLGSAELIFMTGMRFSDIPAICYSVAVWLHYSCLASCSWLLSYAIFLGHQLRQEEDDMCFFNSLGGAVPVVVVIISVVWRYTDYRDPDYCWLSSQDHLDWAFKVPIIFITLATAIVLVSVVKQLLSPANEMRRRQNPEIGSGVRACCVLLPFLSTTWILCDYATALRTTALQISFAITNSILGLCVLLVMFIFNVELVEARRQGKMKLKSKHKIVPTTDADDPSVIKADE